MKLRHLLLLWWTMLAVNFSAQIKDPVKFKLKVNELSNQEYEAVLTATLENGWHIYSKDLPEDSGIPTEMKVSGANIIPVGKIVEIGKKHDEFSEAFGARIVYFSNTATFKQKFKLKDASKPADVNVEITYQTCNDRVCLAPNTLEFEEKIKVNLTETNSKESEQTPLQETIKDTVNQNTNLTSAENTTPSAQVLQGENSLKVESLNPKTPLTDCGVATEEESSSNWWILILGFIGGLIALLTPCVFPMIPLTVSFFTKGAANKAKGKRDAIIYGIFILVIFILLSIPFHIIDGISGNIFNNISTNVWLNLFFFGIFLFFALSFFGYYDITLPGWIANKSSKAEEAGGLIGIFFMALTLVIVSFSCTGPILGSLLGSAVTGSSDVPMLLTFTLAGFGLSWAIVFGALALFPQALQSLPKSGGWMNTVKVILGFIELALALKFLSKADLVSKTFLLKRELFIVLWIIITIGLVLYLFGKIRFPHDDKNAKTSTTRKVFGVLGIGFVIYLIQGLVPSDRPKLQLLSGILPPINVSYLHNEQEGILGMHPEHDFFVALEQAKKVNKPILIDFTGYGCENCRKMEEFVWSEPDILPILQNEVVLASLYVDDKEELPENEQIKIDMGGGQKKKVKTIGDRWSLFQQVNFNNNSQPHYVLVTPDGKVINKPVSGYMPKEEFKQFLECGVNWFKKNKK
ncbi:protein-disulfide reductase DsbD family protein [Riemerella anatipestifer]|uniref:protein-disulfide reductase DsbD family protein n=1 Tax=Riemerella anatipestifer TaxID=34085 RepID=UPI0007EDB8AF|nr:thioredoxin family protein [Riemerella anatipestifer]AZZ59064.1 protein-disulfide reductase [Riemerella anatipestifer]MCW0511159.1 protein-disulfide reductase DsbD family protein [Riemerella anatipestifer]MCW0519661.1 protein-disulfide reductase DsbD family protein [Riemerella anatipestifer]MDD1538935.1 protein-disulfide reductase [Riemerella anatipestifer]MDY3390975.1 protein-disulfide reductase DsbD family protein [Riemerella anatipestifer]